MTNGGKTTLATSLQEQIPNSCIIAQDSYFKVDCEAVFMSYCYFSSLGASITYASFFRMTLRCWWTAMGSSNMTVRTICFTLYYWLLEKPVVIRARNRLFFLTDLYTIRLLCAERKTAPYWSVERLQVLGHLSFSFTFQTWWLHSSLISRLMITTEFVVHLSIWKYDLWFFFYTSSQVLANWRSF